MGIFSNSDQSHKNTRSDNSTTIITAGTKIKGDINLSCNIYIDGYFEGNITSEKEVNIGKSGKVKGEIHAYRVVIQGLSEGYINASKVNIRPDGKVNGSVESEEFVIEAKGIFEGNSSIKKKNQKETPSDTSIENKNTPTQPKSNNETTLDKETKKNI